MQVINGDATDEIVLQYALGDPNVELDLSAEPWNLLAERQASVLIGVDVTRTGGLRSAGGRRSLGVSLDTDDQNASAAQGLDVYGRTGIRYRDKAIGADTLLNGTSTSNRLIKLGNYTDTGGTSEEDYEINVPGGFTNYTYRAGDKCWIVAPATHVGLYDVASQWASQPSNYIALATSAGADTSGDIWLRIFRGRGYGIYDDGELMKSPLEYAATGPWPSEMLSAYIWKNADDRREDQEARRIATRASNLNPNDTITWVNDWTDSWDAEDKFNILYSKVQDKRGVWVTNGRKFWLFQGGSFTLYMDLGSDTYLGEVWHGARIANQLVMFVNPTYPPRVVRIDRPAETGTSDSMTLAGLVAPVKPVDQEGIPVESRSWHMSRIANAGSLTGGNVKAKIRAVNDDDGGESNFVDVRPSGGAEAWLVTYNGDAIAVWTPVDRKLPTAAVTPPLHERITHIEFWRTTANSSNYYLESRIELAKVEPVEEDTTSASHYMQMVTRKQVNTSAYSGMLSDVTLTGMPILTGSDLAAGGLPPICKRVATFQGVTVCAGAAADSPINPSLDNKDFHNKSDNYSTYIHNDFTITATTYTIFEAYAVTAGDRFEILSSDQGITGIYEIATKAGVSTITLSATDNPGGDLTGIVGQIRRAFEIDWPTIESDEDIWYSRTDKFAPESFPTRTLRLSRTGDTFRAMVNVGNYLAVIMSSGVHLLYFSGTALVRDTIAAFGEGTPWADSVVVVGQSVIWAAVDGPKVMAVSNSPNQSGHRANIQQLDSQGRMRDWFREAFDNGYPIDAGVDPLNNCIRWRRKGLGSIGSVVTEAGLSRGQADDDGNVPPGGVWAYRD